MTKYRKKPVVIEALQNDGSSNRLVEIGEWATDSMLMGGPEGEVYVDTLEGDMRADVGDWIIRGVAGEFYPCKDAIFRQTYELVDGDEIAGDGGCQHVSQDVADPSAATDPDRAAVPRTGPTLAEPTHQVAWTIDGDWIGGALTCSAPVGSDCRLVCDHGCEMWPCEVDGHDVTDSGECNAALWIGETGLAESHGGGGTETVRDAGVDVWWTGTAWMWAYRKEAS